MATHLHPRTADIGGLLVGRVLPQRAQRSVGPFVFLDEMGPADLPAGGGIDVPPHPHIGLSTLTYLLSGEIVHRDSLGCTQAIRPGDVNWMTAGHGVTHSERSGEQALAHGQRLHGVQAWVALDPADETCEPSFEHHPGADLPTLQQPGVQLRVLAGAAFGARSPVSTRGDLFYVDAAFEDDATLTLDRALGQRAVFVLFGSATVNEQPVAAHELLAVEPDEDCVVAAPAGARLLLLGGPPRTAPLHMHWNYVASTPERLTEAKARWAAGGFPPVVGDDGAPAVDPRG